MKVVTKRLSEKIVIRNSDTGETMEIMVVRIGKPVFVLELTQDSRGG